MRTDPFRSDRAVTSPRLHRKPADPRGVEAPALRLVQGPGIIPLLDVDGDELVLAAADCSVADVLAHRGRLPAREVRAVVTAAATALARVHERGLVHGDVKPANLLLGDGELWLADFDAAGAIGTARCRHSPGRGASATLTPGDDVRALVGSAIECAVGHPIDAGTSWAPLQLAELGCPADLAAALAMVRRRPPTAAILATMLATTDMRLPAPSAPTRADRTPTVEFSVLDWR